MSLLNKEKIFTLLRGYHENLFPAVFSSEAMRRLRIELEVLEDQITSMALSLVSGKSVFSDSSEELHLFQKKVSILPNGDRKEDQDRNLFSSKISQLLEILSVAKESSFRLKTVRVAKIAKAV